jgi:hypothetical protein
LAKKVAAQFAAYVWIENMRGPERSQEEKDLLCRENWMPFLPVAHEGLGRLLLKIAAGRASRNGQRKQSERQELMTVG